MGDVGPIVPYYIRTIRSIDLSTGNVLGMNYIYGFLSIITFVFLIALALLIIRARPKNPENRFMFVLLLAKAYRPTGTTVIRSTDRRPSSATFRTIEWVGTSVQSCAS